MSPWNQTDGGTSGSGVVRSFVHRTAIAFVELVVVVARSFAG